MKTWKFLLSVLVIGFVMFNTTVNAQTHKTVLTMNFTEWYFSCLDSYLSGTWSANFTFYVSPKTGVIERMHWNAINSDLHDSYTGESLRCLDTGNDNLGVNFWFFNNINSANGYPNLYNVEDGWLNEYMPSTLPEEGTWVEMNLKFIFKGEIYNMSFMTQIHKNANGEITVDNSKTIINCVE